MADFFSSFLENRIKNLSPFGNTEEEDTGNAKPVTQTVKTDPNTGEQTMTIKGSPYDLSAANPNTPTVTMPTGGINNLAGPQTQMPSLAQNAAMVTPQIAPATTEMPQSMMGNATQAMAPAAPMAPAASPMAPAAAPMAEPAPTTAVQPVPGYDPASIAQVLQQAGLNYASPQPIATLAQAGTSDVNPPAVTTPPAAVAMPVAAPVSPVTPAATPAAPVSAPVAPVAEPAVATQPSNVVIPAVTPTVAAPAVTNPIINAYNNPDPKAKQKELETIVANPDISDGERSVARALQRDMLNDEAAKVKAEKKLETATPNDLARYMKERNDEGSYIKAILFGRLGLNELAKEEQMKLGGGRVMGAETDAQGNHYTVLRNASGGIVKAFDSNGTEVDEKKLSSLSAESVKMKGAATGQTLGKDDKGNVWSHTVIPGTSRMIWQNQSTGDISSRAPSGYHSMGQKEADVLIREKAIGTAAQIEASMRRQNASAADRGLPAPHTEADIQRERQTVLNNAGVTTGTGSSNLSSNAALASSGGRSAAEINNPTGLGWNGTTWNPYDTPKEGVDASVAAVRGYLGSEGVMKNVKPTPENVVGMWVNGDPSSGPKVQNGSYVSSVRKELSAAGVDLNSDGTIPNTPEAARAIVRAQIQHETAPANQGKFLEHVGGPVAGTPPTTTSGAPATTPPAVPTNAAAQANKTKAEQIANYLSPPLTGAGDKGRNLAIMEEVAKINPDYNAAKYSAAKKLREEFASTKPNTSGGQLQAVNRAIPHLAQYELAVKALNNGDMPLVNKIMAQYNYNIGDDKIAAAKSIQGLVSTEVQKAVAGGLGGVEERRDLASQMGTQLNPKQLAGVIQQYKELMAAQAVGLKQTWTSNGLPAKEFNGKLVPQARSVIEHHENEANNPRSSW